MLIKSRKEAAAALGVTEKSLGDWKKKPGFPHRPDGQYDIDAIRAWNQATSQRPATVAPGANGANGAAAGSTANRNRELAESIGLKTKATKLQILELQRQRADLELQREQGHLMPRELVKELLSILAARIRDVTTNLVKAGNTDAADAISRQLEVAERQIHERLEQAMRSPQG